MSEGNILSRTLGIGNGDMDCLKPSGSPGKLDKSGLVCRKSILHKQSWCADMPLVWIWCLTADEESGCGVFLNQLFVWMSPCRLLMDVGRWFLLFPGRFLVKWSYCWVTTAGEEEKSIEREARRVSSGCFFNDLVSVSRVSLESYLNGNCFSTGHKVIYRRFNLVQFKWHKNCVERFFWP